MPTSVAKHSAHVLVNYLQVSSASGFHQIRMTTVLGRCKSFVFKPPMCAFRVTTVCHQKTCIATVSIKGAQKNAGLTFSFPGHLLAVNIPSQS